MNGYEQEYPIIGMRERAGSVRDGEVYPEWKTNTALSFQAVAANGALLRAPSRRDAQPATPGQTL